MAILNQINLNGNSYNIGGASVVELTEYLTEGSVLPWTGLYVCGNQPISHLRVIQDGATSWSLIFCIQHMDASEESGFAFHTFGSSTTGWEYMTSYDNTNVPEWILRAFGENIASTQFSGKMSSTDKAKLDGIPTGAQLTQLFAAKQDKMPVAQVASGTTAINAAVNTYYEVAGEVGALAITLPTPTDLTKVSMVVIHLLAGTTPNVVIGSTATIDYSAAYDISAGNEYEINCLYDGDKWVVADMEVV